MAARRTDPPTRVTVAVFGQGGIIGDLDFYAEQPRSFSAIALDDAEAYELSLESLHRMHDDHPTLAALLQHIVLKSLSLNAGQMELQHTM